MPRTPIAHVRLDRHPEHPDAVTAALAGTGDGADTARALLAGHGFRPLDHVTMVLARIDHEEPHYANQAATALRAAGAAVEITPGLQDEIDTEWTWANYPMPWLTRDEVREVSQEAQKIHDDIAAGRLIIHRHAHDGHTTVAVGTYPGGQSIHLHGENHLRQTTLVYDTTTEALREFDDLYTDVRPGPATATETEQRAAAALAAASSAGARAPGESALAEPAPQTETVPKYAADPGDHETLLGTFLERQGAWEKYRTWSDDTTHAVHEDLTLRVEFDHAARDRTDTAWTIAAYDSPVGERIWHATATATTPVEIIRTLLESLASGNAWGGELDAKITEETLAEATRPFADTGWPQHTDGRCITWTAPTSQPAGLRFDAFAAQRPNGTLATWTLWGGNTSHQPTWTIHLSAYVPASLLHDLTYELAHGEESRQRPNPGPPRAARLAAELSARNRAVAPQSPGVARKH